MTEYDARAPGSKTLLISGTLPGPTGVGGIILGDLCPLFPAGTLCAYLPVSRGRIEEIPAELRNRIPIRLRHLPLERFRFDAWLERLGLPGRALRGLLRWRRRQTLLRQLANECGAFARQHGVGQVWAVMDTPTAILLARTVADMLRVPLLSMVWDDIDHQIRYFQLDRLAARQLTHEFAHSLRQSRGCAVIGESMRDAYQRDYGVPSVVVRHGLSAQLVQPVKEVLGDADCIRIGFAGSVTARSAFQVLLRTLDEIDWSLAGKPVVLRLMGQRFVLESLVPRRIDYLGWRSVPETIRLLSECQINYLPQPFESTWESFARLSFPSKLTTYLGAGVPIVLHAPALGSLTTFFSNYPFGVWCSTLSPDDLGAALLRLVEGSEQYRQASNEIVRAVQHEFTEERFHGQFRRFLELGTEIKAG